MLVEDNGIGMSGDIKGGGLGLRLLQGFSRALKGEVDIRSTSKGTSTSVRFQAPPTLREDDLTARFDVDPLAVSI